MGRKLTILELTIRQYDLLLKKSNKRSTSQHHQERIHIILKSYLGESQMPIAGDLKVDYETVRLGRNRWIKNYALLTRYEQGLQDMGVSDRKLLEKMLFVLTDAPRKGVPRTFTSQQDELLVALACESPTDYGLIRTHWTHQTLAEVAVSKGLFQEISARTVGKLLKKKITASQKRILALPTHFQWARICHPSCLNLPVDFGNDIGGTSQTSFIEY